MPQIAKTTPLDTRLPQTGAIIHPHLGQAMQGIDLKSRENSKPSPLIAVCEAYGISHHDRHLVHEQLLLLAGKINRRRI